MADPTSKVEFPQGDGQPDCPICHGRGVIPVPKEQLPPVVLGEFTTPCTCTLVRDVLANIEVTFTLY